MTEWYDTVVVGGGPRGVATVLRIAARAGDDDPVRVAVVDACEVGAGATWSTHQPAAYLNNTQARTTTIHPDDSTPMTGPAAFGPDLVAWVAQVVETGGHPAGPWVLDEARALGPDDFPTRRLQGVYFRDQLQEAVACGRVALSEVVGTAVDLDRDGADTVVVLRDGRRLTAPTVVLAQGMVQGRRSAEVTTLVRTARAWGLRYVEPGLPAERDVRGLPAGQTVLVRGLGANLFDVMGELIVEWGGSFHPVPGDPHGRLRYRPSGREPRLVAGSRRGLPYRSKPDGGRPVRPFSARWATQQWFAALRVQRRLDFARQVWPVLVKELARAHLDATQAYAPEAVTGGWLEALDAAREVSDVEMVLRDHISDQAWAWQVDHLRHPTGGHRVEAARWADHVTRLVDDELGSMSRAAVHPRAAVNAAMAALRGQVDRVAAAGAVDGSSLVRDVHGWFSEDGLFLASGPPAHRVRQVLALVEAGVVDLLGPGFTVSLDAQQRLFRAESPITGRRAVARVLVEARMSKGEVPDTDDPLLRALLESGRARIHRVDGQATASLEATAAELEEGVVAGQNLVSADGTVDPSVVVIGIPAASTQVGSAIGASPGVPSPLLAGADIAAKQVMARRPLHHAGTMVPGGHPGPPVVLAGRAPGSAT